MATATDTNMAKAFPVTHQRGFGTVAITTFIFLYAPLAVALVFAFNAGTSPAKWGGFSLRWFQSAANNQQVISASILSLKLAAISATLSTALATLAALAMSRTPRFRGWTLAYSAISVPLMVPEIVTAVALLIVTATIRGWTGYSGLGYLILAHTAFCVPFAYLPIRARLQTMDISLERAAGDLYASPWNAFRFVTMPLLFPGILAGFILAFVTSLDDVVITEFVKTAGQDTLPTYMLGQVRRTITPEVNAIAAVFLLISVALVICIYVVNQRTKIN
ncbi:spermidine/putrescine ABC transporter permease PotC [Mesorhizobium erdmanii]|uniref:Spermidine/putrescine transport system permease protein PotC n=4 Tax=Phyllobacteriaceae TaxID=69277 RepID=A0A3M9XA31_9HYPH|nr:ABC transporter permease [Mesorhizobium japonicum]RXT51704.1 spermidine/putrescine ABC transporter permease PotC [Mesorhizobium erdmanii]BAB53152.1 ABC transporter, permease protein [Mesorhizobium japonicum MAFF 303099]